MQTYDHIAEWYDTWLGSDSMRDDPYFPAVAALMGNVAGRRICDLACGQGRLARHLTDQGARIVGIDFSARLLEIARRHERERPRGIEYLHADARRLDSATLATYVNSLLDVGLQLTRLVETSGASEHIALHHFWAFAKPDHQFQGFDS